MGKAGWWAVEGGRGCPEVLASSWRLPVGLGSKGIVHPCLPPPGLPWGSPLPGLSFRGLSWWVGGCLPACAMLPVLSWGPPHPPPSSPLQRGRHPLPGAAEPDPEHPGPLRQPDEVLPVLSGGEGRGEGGREGRAKSSFLPPPQGGIKRQQGLEVVGGGRMAGKGRLDSAAGGPGWRSREGRGGQGLRAPCACRPSASTGSIRTTSS